MLKPLLKYITDFLRTKKHIVFYYDEYCSVCGIDTTELCKNCEEYGWTDHKGGCGSNIHGIWKPISNNWIKYKKYVKPKVLWEYKSK